MNYAEVRDNMDIQRPSAAQREEGLEKVIIGLCMKVLLADTMGFMWNEAKRIGFSSLSTPYAWMAAVAFSMQLYFDFYGCSLMAVGMGKMMGFEIPENFDMPYMAVGVRDFYRRWHMTLGRWFKNYVYIPLGGSRKGSVRTIINLAIVWVLTALWHGFSINFLIWGGLLCLCVVVERALSNIVCLKKIKILPHIITLVVIPVTWMCFAITDLNELYTYIGRMSGLVQGINVRGGDYIAAFNKYGIYFCISLIMCTPVWRKAYEKIKDSMIFKLLLAVLFWFCITRIGIYGDNPFLYSKF